MALRGTDPESYISEYTQVYEDKVTGAFPLPSEQRLVLRHGWIAERLSLPLPVSLSLTLSLSHALTLSLSRSLALSLSHSLTLSLSHSLTLSPPPLPSSDSYSDIAGLLNDLAAALLSPRLRAFSSGPFRVLDVHA